MKKIFATLLAVMMLAFCFAGCGQSASSAPAASTPADAAGDGPALTAIKESGTLTMMTATGFPPYEYIGEDGKPAGVDIDLAQLVADKLGVKLEVLDMDFNLLVDSLKSGKGQLVVAGMSWTEERAAQIDFSVGYAKDGQCLMVPVGSSIETVEDLEGVRVVVQEATTGHILASEEYGLEPMAFKNAVDCAATIMSGNADVAILDRTTILSLVSGNPDKLALVDNPLTDEQYMMGIAKGNEDFKAIVDEVLQAAIDDGTFDALMEKHLAIIAEG